MIEFVTVDASKIYENLIIQFQTALDEILYPGDERRIFLEQQTQLLVALYNSINETGKQNLLRYAKGEVLDAIGEEKDTPRLQAQTATSVVRFTVSAAQTSNILIPAGTRVTPDGQLFFSTIKDAVILPGILYIDIDVISTEAGEKYNSFLPGQLNKLVDPIAFIGSVSNTVESSGGSDIELDDDGVNVWSGYRERLRLASSKQSTAGHEEGYKYWAKTADVNIKDVKVTSPSDGEVLITILMKDGELPSQDVLDKVVTVCSPKKVRALTDKVSAAAPTEVSYNINFTYYISKENEATEQVIRSSIEGTDGAVEKYITWQDTSLERDINPDYLRKLLLNAGADRITLVSPSFTAVNDISKAKVGTVTVTYGGLV